MLTLSQQHFGHKLGLATGCDQRAALRNRLRRSRSMTKIARKDGETDILWFRTC